MSIIERIGAQRCAVGESPLWSGAEQAWYWVDIVARTVWRHHPATGALDAWRAEEMVACLATRADGGLIAGMETGLFALTPEPGGPLRQERLSSCADLQP